MQTLLKKVSHASTLFPESNYYSFNSVVTADIASSVESKDPAEDPCSDDDPDPTGEVPDHRQFTSSTFLEIIHHPHSGIKEPEIIFCDLSSAGLEENLALQAQHCLGGKPWAPFHTRADFEFSETVIGSSMHTATIEKLIKGIKQSWTDPGHSRITFQGMKDFKQSMNAARKFVVQVCTFGIREEWLIK